MVAEEVHLRLKTAQECESIIEVTLRIYRIIGSAGCSCSETSQINGIPKV
jgi:hypothetical protein